MQLTHLTLMHHAGTAGPLTSIAAPSNTPPRIRLLGLSTVELPQGMAYSVCRYGQAANEGAYCDKGVVAEDAEDGDLTVRVTACGSLTPFSVRAWLLLCQFGHTLIIH